MPAPKLRHRPTRRPGLTAFVVAMAVLIATPLAVVASDAFTDVPDSNVHHADITWLADAGVTLGCNPPANTNFCPGEPVLRQQMASFLRRLAENQVVDAATAQDADMLDGKDGTAYETSVVAASCGIVVVGGTAETTCLPSAGGMINAEASAEVFALEINAQTAGALQLSTTALSQDPVVWAYTMDVGCSSTVEVFVDRAVDGHIFAADTGSSTAAHLTTSIGAGTHTIRLCGLNTSLAAIQLFTASLSTQWTAGGSVEIAGRASSPIDLPAILGG